MTPLSCRRRSTTPQRELGRHFLRGVARGLLAGAALCLYASAAVSQQGTSPAPVAGAPGPLPSLPSLDVPPYMGLWYQIALFPNFFQRQCVSDTTATYRQLPGGTVEVTNRCRTESGSFDQVIGVARPTGSLQGRTLAPAQLEVTFLPTWLRWLPVGWGRYWVIQLADDGRYAVVSEPSREYLWILARQPRLSAADETAIRARLQEQGFDLTRLQAHRHGASP